jgi:Ion channel
MHRGFVAGFALIVVCTVLHTIGMVVIAEQLIHDRERLERKFTLTYLITMLILVFVVIIVVDLIEVGIWAAAYRFGNLIPSFEAAFYFSLGSYTTIGAGSIVLPEEWRILSGLESFAGMLLGGLSTAFLFTIIRRAFEERVNHRQSKKSSAGD